jgi:type I restriction enzyme S subunit
MAEQWQTTKLGALGEFRNGVNFNRGQEGPGLPVVKVKDFGSKVFAPAVGLDELSIPLAELPQDQLLKDGDIIIIRSNGSSALVGRSVVFQDAGRPTTFSGFCIRFRPDKNRIDPAFAAYYLRSPFVRQRFSAFGSGTGIQNLSQSILAELPLKLPEMAEQRRIAELLRALDERIELNRRMNEKLEAIARAVFKSWFVDFDIVRAKAEDRHATGSKKISDLFPSGFQNSERGLAPKGWNFKTVGEVTDRVGMGPFGASIKVETFVSEGIPIISGQHLRRFVLDDNTFNFIKDEHAERLANAIVRRGDVIFTHAGNIGQVALIPSNSRYDRYILSQRQFFMRCNLSQITPTFAVLYFSSAEGQQALLANTSSSGVPSIARPVTYLRSIRLLVPPKEVLDAFQSVVEPLIRKLRQNDDENEALANVRDFLLPKVMSGAIRIKGAEKIVEAQA